MANNKVKMIFCNTAYLEYYDSDKKESVFKNGGSYPEEYKTGIEVDNFHKFGDVYYGGVETGSKDDIKNPGKKIRNKLNIENIDETISKNAESASDITVVFCAKSDELGNVVVGWYKNATVYRNYRYRDDDRDGKNEREYNIEAHCEDCLLLPIQERTLKVPRATKDDYGFGESQVWYAKETNSKTVIFRNKVLAYIEEMENKLKNC